MGNHTKEPWVLYCDNRSKTLEINDGHGHEHRNAVVAWPGFDSSAKSWAEKVANARRIVACVNACAGKSNKELERAALPLAAIKGDDWSREEYGVPLGGTAQGEQE